MGLLFPLYFLALAGLAVPLLLHLRRKPPKNIQDFPSLMLLKPSPEEKKTKRQLDDIILLLLRCLALALLIFAFARPFFGNGTEGDGLRKNLVLLLDRSASMQRDGLWDEATDKAVDLASDLNAQDRLTVLAFGKTTSALASDSSWDGLAGSERANGLRNLLKEIGPGWGATDLGAALLVAIGHTQDDHTDSSDPDAAANQIQWNHEVVVLSDLQAGTDLDRLGSLQWPEGIELRLVQVGLDKKAISNASIHPMPPADDGAMRVLIRNAEDSGKETFEISTTTTDGKMPDAAKPLCDSAYVPAGFSRVVTFSQPASEHFAFTVALFGDDEPFDNLVSFAKLQPQDLAIQFLGEAAQLENPDQAGYYLKRAFQPTPTLNPTVAVGTPDPARVSSSFAVVDGPAPELDAFLQAGGHALILASPRTAPLLLRYGITDRGEEIPDRHAVLTEVDFEHPILAPFSDARLRDFSKIRTWRYRKLELTTRAQEQSRILATFDGSAPAWIDIPAGPGGGRLLVLASSWAPRDSQLALSTKFVPLLYGSLNWAGIDARQGLRIEVGERQAFAEPGIITTPDGTTIDIAADQLSFTPKTPGLFRFDPNSRDEPVFYPVNLHPDEGDLGPLPADTLSQWGLLKPGDSTESITAISDPDTEEKSKRPGALVEAAQRSWRWWIIGALAILLLETWWSNRHRSAPSPTTAQPKA